MALSSPIYEQPLTDQQMIVLARITLMWAHIDTQIDSLIKSLYAIDGPAFDRLFGSKTIGPKIEDMIAIADRIADLKVRSAVKNLGGALKGCVAARNLITHGVWGWEYKKSKRTFRVCANSEVKKSKFYADELDAFHERLSRAARDTDVAFYLYFTGSEPPQEINRRQYFLDCPMEQVAVPWPARLTR